MNASPTVKHGRGQGLRTGVELSRIIVKILLKAVKDANKVIICQRMCPQHRDIRLTCFEEILVRSNEKEKWNDKKINIS
jgi:hypothetical protein